MGLVQKGRSRTWLDDRGWWLGVVEFQPSSWSRGSYLNVGCSWLWQVKDYLSFDQGGPAKPFTGLRDEKQFRAVADQLARQAAEEINRYRRLFPNVDAVYSYYLCHHPTGFWPNFNAGVACALAGQPKNAQRFFSQVTESKEKVLDWFLAAQADAKQLSALAPDAERFRRAVADRVRRTRELQKLPPVSRIDFG